MVQTFFILSGTSHVDKVRKYIESGKPCNDVIITALDPIMIILNILYFAQFIVTCVSFRRLEVCHILIHFHFLIMALMYTLPYKEDEAERNKDFYLECLIIFSVHYCKNFYLACISFALTALVFETMSMLHHSEIEGPRFIRPCFSYSMIVASFEVVRIWINLQGKNIVKNKVMRAGFEKLLNNLEESVIIANRKTGLLLFANSAALKASESMIEPICKIVKYEDMQMSFMK